MTEKKTAELREVTKAEMSQVEGGLMSQFLDDWVGVMTGGLVGYGPGGFYTVFQTATKSKK